jgi:AraC-like DNA-binding protein
MLGKTRQEEPGDSVPDQSAAGKSRGVLGWPSEMLNLAVSRRLPGPELAAFIAHYWTIRWNLAEGQSYLQETLPHPNVYMVFEDRRLMVAGVSTRKFTRLLQGREHVFGIKFKPGGFHPFLQRSVSGLTDQIVAASSVFGKDADGLEATLTAATKENEEDEMVAAAGSFLRSRAPQPDESAALAGECVALILREPEIKTVEDLAQRMAIGKRSLQRIFSEYVGVSPKWVIRRYRLHELVERLNSGEDPDWAAVALELGYFDQSHLITDFRSIVGHSPAGYQRSIELRRTAPGQ